MARALQKSSVVRIYVLYALMVLAAFVILARIIQLQFVENAKWQDVSNKQSYKTVDVKAIRGNIYSDDYSLLATSVPVYNLYWDSKVVTDKVFEEYIDSLSIGFAAIYSDVSKSKFEQRLISSFNQRKRYVRIRRSVSYAELKQIKNLPIFRLGKYKGGLIIDKKERRKRPYGMLAKRTIGNYSTYKNAYVVGLEGAFDEKLKGVDGLLLKQRSSGEWQRNYEYNDDKNAPVEGLFTDTLRKPIDGVDIVTTIDVNLQDVAETSLYRELVKHKADWGCAILMEVKTGHIKAIANLKHDTARNTYYEGFNYAIGTAMEPGSTFKLATMMISLENNIVTPKEIIKTGNGSYTYYGSTIHDSHGYGDITVSEVLEKSSNVGIFKIALKGFENNPQTFIDGIYSMNLNNPLGLQIKGEALPYIKTTKDKTWSKLSLPWMSIGYELKLTPLQTLNFYNAVANNGTMLKPSFVKAISKTGEYQETFDPKVINEQISSIETIKKVQKMLEGVVENGTAKALSNSPYPIAGKTGTAQISNKSGYNKINYQASFVGYFPADNPKYSCIVVVNNPSTGQYYASTVVVPVFKDIADKIYASDLSIQVHAEKDTVFIAPNSKVGTNKDIVGIYNYLDYEIKNPEIQNSFIAGYSKNDSIKLYKRKLMHNRMPNLKNMTAQDAIFLVEELGLTAKIIGFGKVASQSIPKNNSVKVGQIVTIKMTN
ncbi:MAG: transpeptidase family protein [Bacteroidales bacterium]|nr:transpeptidase family protein [Bacteroidales bacterium]